MNEIMIQNALRELLDLLIDERNDPESDLADLTEPFEGVRDVRTFAEADILTTDKGLIVACEDGTEYQLTIVRSR
jgi:hypothetical protein